MRPWCESCCPPPARAASGSCRSWWGSCWGSGGSGAMGTGCSRAGIRRASMRVSTCRAPGWRRTTWRWASRSSGRPPGPGRPERSASGSATSRPPRCCRRRGWRGSWRARASSRERSAGRGAAARRRCWSAPRRRSCSPRGGPRPTRAWPASWPFASAPGPSPRVRAPPWPRAWPPCWAAWPRRPTIGRFSRWRARSSRPSPASSRCPRAPGAPSSCWRWRSRRWGRRWSRGWRSFRRRRWNGA